MKRLFLVVEDSIIWAAFPRRAMALQFAAREFGVESPTQIVPLAVYVTLEQAPTTHRGRLKAAAIWYAAYGLEITPSRAGEDCSTK